MALFPSDSENLSLHQKPSGAPLADRMLALAFDLCLWVPSLLLLVKPIWREFQYHQMLSPGSTEAMLFMAIGLGVSVVLIVFAQTLMIARWGTTPGKRIFQISVVRLEDGARLSWGASLLRACTQLFELCLLGLPFLEILSHPERRPWHDRLAESHVVSLKGRSFEAPHWLEQRFFRNLYWGFSLSVVLMFGSFMWKTHQQLAVGAFKREELRDSGYLCESLQDVKSSELLGESESRMDFALAMYNAGLVSSECLESEADFAFWTQNSELLPWASLIRGVLAQEKGFEAKRDEWTQYFEAACPEEKAPGVEALTPGRVFLCRLVDDYWSARTIQNKSVAQELGEQIKSRSLTEKVRSLHHLIEEGKFALIEASAAEENWPLALIPYLQEVGLKSLYLQNRNSEFSSASRLVTRAWSTEDREKSLAWTCFADRVQSCGKKNAETCRDLRRLNQHNPNPQREVTLALGFDLWCSNKRDAQVEAEIRLLRERDPLLSWMSLGGANAHESKTTRTQQFQILSEKLREMPSSHWARIPLLWWAGRFVESEKQFEILSAEYQRSSRRDPSWWLAQRSLLESRPSSLKGVPLRGLSSVNEGESQ